jgi:hypothetical protein
MAGKKQSSSKKSYEPLEDDGTDAEGWEDDPVDVDVSGRTTPAGRLRDWRDIERYREERELRRLIEDEYELDHIAEPPPARRRR